MRNPESWNAAYIGRTWGCEMLPWMAISVYTDCRIELGIEALW